MVTAAVVMIGSNTVRLACGTNFNTRALAGCAIENRGSEAAATPAAPARRNDRRLIDVPPLGLLRRSMSSSDAACNTRLGTGSPAFECPLCPALEPPLEARLDMG